MDTGRFDHTGDYVPDPEREITALIDAFFERIRGTLLAHDFPATALPGIRSGYEDLVSANRHQIVDEPARYNLRMTMALLAAHHYLEPRLGRAESLAAVRVAFVEPFADVVRAQTAALLDAAADPFAAMVAVSKSREEYAFGAGFRFERPADDDQRYHLDIRRCFYHDVLVANSAAELTPVMCEFDANWIEAIDPDRHGFRFERETTIGRGATHCPFYFDRTEPGPG